MPEPSILDARVADIDRRLRVIQCGLEPVPDREPGAQTAPGGQPESAAETSEQPTPLRPAPSLPRSRWRLVSPRSQTARAPGPAPPPADPAPGGPELVALTIRLRELTATQERLLAATQDLLVEHALVLSRVAPTLGVSAGPFIDTAMLREFEQALAGLPRVREVAVREYAGAEHAVLDVHLWPATS